MKHFEPLMTYLSPLRTARVRMPETSEPASGSVRQKEASFGAATSVLGELALELLRAPEYDRRGREAVGAERRCTPEQPHDSSSSIMQPSR